MTEQEWLECKDSQPMLDFLRAGARDRKLRLFACICSSRFSDWLDTEHDRKALEVAEQMADGKVARQEYADAHVHQYDLDLGAEEAFYPAIKAATVAGVCAADRIRGGDRSSQHYAMAEVQELGVLCDLLRDIIGNPFRPVSIDPTCITPAVLDLAQAIYDDRAFDELPILADALEEAGCQEQSILEHLRSPGPHVRGCWPLDMILGRV